VSAVLLEARVLIELTREERTFRDVLATHANSITGRRTRNLHSVATRPLL